MKVAAAAAGAMYFYDPDSGRRRRARLREKAIHLGRLTSTVLNAGRRDLENRGRGLVHNMRAQVAARLDDQPVPDSVLQERVRSKLGRACSHPHAIEVTAHDGQVTLRGPILRDEAETLARAVRRVVGVREVSNQLEVHDSSENVPALQGGSPGRGKGSEPWQRNWSPAFRLLGVGAGGIMLLRALIRRGLGGLFSAFSGVSLFLTSVSNKENNPRGIDIQKRIEIQAPIETVFSLWQRLEEFPRIMSHIKEVRLNEDGTYHWKVTGPGGVSVEWDAELTELETNRTIAWRSTTGAPIQNEGVVHFLPGDNGATQLDVRIAYHPPGGAFGHALAALFGADPKKQLDDDLLRFKSLVEQGRTRGREGLVTLDELLSPAGTPSMR
jgi:uncharacterized membrane protein